MNASGIREVCSFCQHDGRVEPAIVSLRVEFALLPCQWLDHDGLLVRDDPTYACAAHLHSAARVALSRLGGRFAVSSGVILGLGKARSNPHTRSAYGRAVERLV